MINLMSFKFLQHTLKRRCVVISCKATISGKLILNITNTNCCAISILSYPQMRTDFH